MRRVAFAVAMACVAGARTHAVRADGRAAEDDGAVRVGAAIGAGGQGPATYGAVELRLDAAWPDAGVSVSLGGRAVWEDGVFRRADWARAADAVTLVRDVRAARAIGDDTTVALAAGGLAPSHLADAADGERATLDDHPRTGVRVAFARRDPARTRTQAAATLEIDDVLDPALIGGAARVAVAPAWDVLAAVAIDPGASPMLVGAAMPGAHGVVEAGVARRFARVELDGGLLVDGAGASAITAARAERDAAGVRWTAAVDLRAGTGAVGAAFGPLYRAERATLWDRAHMGELAGAGGGVSFGARADAGWVDASLRARPGLGPLATLAAGAPLGRYVQAAGWLATARDASAGAAELRVAWARRLFSAIQLARMIRADDTPAWSLTAWFGAGT